MEVKYKRLIKRCLCNKNDQKKFKNVCVHLFYNIEDGHLGVFFRPFLI